MGEGTYRKIAVHCHDVRRRELSRTGNDGNDAGTGEMPKPSMDEAAYTGLFISPSGISELDRATTKTYMAERSISIGRESLQVFFVLGALAYFQVPPLGGSHDEKWRSQ